MSFLFKGIDGLVYFLIVPATLGFLDKYSYGIWLTLNSILMWINTFDAGLGNGMRNCLTISLARNEQEKSRIYISTTYVLLSIISLAVFAVFLVLCNFIDWYVLLNVDREIIPNLQEVIVCSFFIFCVSFVFKLIGSIYMALQLPSINYFFLAAGHLLSLILILLLRLISDEGSLFWVAVVYSASPCIVYFIASIVTFAIIYKHLRPSFHLVRIKEYSPELLNVGVGFFILQVSSLVIFSMSNVVISRLIGPDMVTPYNISNRYMAIALMALTITMAPVWSAITDAKARGDQQWIGNCVKKINRTVWLFGGALLVMLAVSPLVYRIWVGDSVEIPFTLSALMCLYIFILVWSTSKSSVLNGMDILRVQLIVTVFQAIAFLPVSYFFGRQLGLNGIVIAMIIINLPAMISNSVQVRMIIKGTAKGVWLK